MIADTALYLFGIQGKTLNNQEIEWLNHPLTAGVILFTRNYKNPQQIKKLVKTIRETAKNGLLLAVDHEGGRVQRFRKGFTVLPAMAELGKIYDIDSAKALALARATAYVLAYEIGRCDIDFSFAPVLDVQTKDSPVIGDRAFHNDVKAIQALAGAFYDGLHEAGMAAVGKHFPGHGNVGVDSHLSLPVCQRSFKTLLETDLPPFKSMIIKGIEAIMPAHIRYAAVDDLPAGFSAVWLQKILRQQLRFNGCIISDDLDMAGAQAYGDMTKRVTLARKHCDLILLCNHHENMKVAFTTQATEKTHCDSSV